MGLVWLVAALTVSACGEDASSGDDDTSPTEEPTTGDDDSAPGDDDSVPGDDDSAPGDDDSGDDDTPPPNNMDGGRPDAGWRMDASRVDAASDAGVSSKDASDSTDGSASDGSVVDAALGMDAGGDASADGAADGALGDGQTGDAGERADLGEGDGSDVLLIGDSWMNNAIPFVATGGGIGPALIDLSMQPYRDNAVQGACMLASCLGTGPIPNQWDAAVRRDDDIKTVVMTGGGNDIIQNAAIERDCRTGGERCQERLEEVARSLKALWDRMAAAGVQDIVHVLYAKVAGDVQDIDENNQGLRDLCAAVAAPTRCHIFATDTYVPTTRDLADGIHPTAAANQRIARGLYEYMEENGIRR